MHTTRRRFVSALLPLGVGVSAYSGTTRAMKLSLSVRVAEEFFNKEKTTMTLDQLVAMARRYHFDALCMRASQVGVQSTQNTLKDARRKIDAAGLRVSMVTGDFAVPSNNDHGPDLLRNITPHLDLAETLGADLIRVCMKKDEDIVHAQRASDEARERKIRLAHQSHCASLFETVDGSLRVLKAVGRPNFGIVYEPANWLISGQEYGRQTIKRLQPYLFNVYVQNHRLTPNGSAAIQTWNRGKVRLDHIGIWEKGGVNYDEVAAGLKEIGYHGYVTIHQAFGDVMPVDEAVRRSREYLGAILPVSS
jgi:sugar phosphate isomerase/epimerase